METESTLSPEQVEECRAMFREACGNIVDQTCAMYEWFGVIAELCPMLRIDYEQTVQRILTESQSRCAGRR